MTVEVAIEIPVLDISGENVSQIAEQLVAAAATHGFVFVKNTGTDIPVAAFDQAFDLSKSFFSSPLEDKETCTITADNRGWSGMHTETLDAKTQRVGDFKEAFNIAEFANGKAQQPLPPSLTAHEQDLSDFFTFCHNLCIKLLKLFATGLAIPESAGGPTYFSSKHDPTKGESGCILRLLHYPSVPEDADYIPDVDIRAGAHSDYGSVTLLFQRPGQPGLEILTPSGTWASVPVFPPSTEHDPSPPILINIGDAFSFWTNGLLKSTVHRVIFPKNARRGGEDRYSIAFFCHPNHETVLDAVPSAMVEQRARDGAEGASGAAEKITAHEHLMRRLKATYLDLDFEGDKE